MKKNQKHLFLSLYIVLCLFLLAGVYWSQLQIQMKYQLNQNRSLISQEVEKKVSELAKKTTYCAALFKPLNLHREEELVRSILSKQVSPSYVSGGLYVFQRAGKVIATTDLPTDHAAKIVPYSNIELCATTPHTRSSDGEKVITIYRRLSDTWRLAADIPLRDFSAYFAQEQGDFFYYLLDNTTMQILTSPDEDYLGKRPEEVQHPLFPLNLPNLPLSNAQSLIDTSGQKYYWSASQLQRYLYYQVDKDWILLYYQTPKSLMKDALEEGFYPWESMAVVATVLILIGLVLFLPRRKKTGILEENVNNSTVPQRRGQYENE